MDIMLDLETLGKKPGCIVLSIGAIAFDPLGDELPAPENSGRCFYQNCTIFDQLLAGFTIDPDTLDFWRSERVTVAAIDALRPDQITIEGALFRLVTWCNNLPQAGMRPRLVWAKSPEFDCSILEHTAAHFGVNLPWDFRGKADVRTMEFAAAVAYNPELPTPPKPERKGTHHNALDDCYYQAATVQAYSRGIRHGTKA